MRLFTVLWLAGMTGVASLLLSGLPLPESVSVPLPLWQLRLLLLIQPTLLVTIAVGVGVLLAPRVGLAAPVASAIASGGAIPAALSPQVIPGIVGGLVGGSVLVASQGVAGWVLPQAVVTKLQALSSQTSLLTRLLYGGITEEVLMRWGLMTLFVWILWKIFARTSNHPMGWCFAIAIGLSAGVFGLGHLPLAFALNITGVPALIAYVIVANSLFGVIAGLLYWHWGLEAAMIAHIVVHGVLVTVTSLTGLG